ncbi:BrnA antitoxin family protein [Tardiphaga sp. 813_E8_N1_3]|uniref:BrnA antitoxin family protein n=1 Tax=Tardiphaga sp. 813_E8_N1_3 TaxID=3240760 RepID=UPI003F24A420
MSARKKTPPATHDDNPEWTAADFAASRPAEELPPDILAQFKNKPGRPRTENPKIPVKLRLDDDVVTALRATGPGWQTRINDMLKSRIKRGKIEFVAFGDKPKPRTASGAAKRKRA